MPCPAIDPLAFDAPAMLRKFKQRKQHELYLAEVAADAAENK